LAIFAVVQYGIKQFGPQATPATTTGTASTNEAAPAKVSIPVWENRPKTYAEGVVLQHSPEHIAPLWNKDQPLDFSIYLSPSIIMPPFKAIKKEILVVSEKSFGYGNYKDTREISTTFAVPKETQTEGQLWAHVFVAQSGAVMDPLDSKFDSSKAYHFARPFSQYLPKKKVKKARSLLEAKNESEAELEEPSSGPQFAYYYHPNFTLSFVPDQEVQHYPSILPAMKSFIQLESTNARDASGANGWYYPTLYVNTFWQLRTHMTELNDTVKELPLHITLNNIGGWKYSILANMDEGMKINAAKAAAGEATTGGDGSEIEMFKTILLDSNIYLLSITGIASILHMVFEALAFKSDVSHWRNKKDNVGTSFRTILANVFMQLIIFLYLLDNNENTSWMILFSQGMGIAIEAWKITKTVNVRIRPTPEGSLIPYTITFEDKHQLSESEQKTKEYDEIAFKYLYIVAVPLLLAYAAYSLVYETHKSWYSFIITTLVGSVYAYGFLMMVPSLYINYRLKSVAHMPGKAMMYKFLNTFIDDLFAFTIKMPWLHRLSTLRDDVIFFVYLYQTWKYKVDYTRVNEFGQGGADDDVKADEGKASTKPLAAAPEAGAEADAKALLTEDVKSAEKEIKAKASGVESGGKGRRRK
jgi:hypothetical protein